MNGQRSSVTGRTPYEIAFGQAPHGTRVSYLEREAEMVLEEEVASDAGIVSTVVLASDDEPGSSNVIARDQDSVALVDPQVNTAQLESSNQLTVMRTLPEMGDSHSMFSTPSDIPALTDEHTAEHAAGLVMVLAPSRADGFLDPQLHQRPRPEKASGHQSQGKIGDSDIQHAAITLDIRQEARGKAAKSRQNMVKRDLQRNPPPNYPTGTLVTLRIPKKIEILHKIDVSFVRYSGSPPLEDTSCKLSTVP